jgi:hypothetical protein
MAFMNIKTTPKHILCENSANSLLCGELTRIFTAEKGGNGGYAEFFLPFLLFHTDGINREEEKDRCN